MDETAENSDSPKLEQMVDGSTEVEEKESIKPVEEVIESIEEPEVVEELVEGVIVHPPQISLVEFNYEHILKHLKFSEDNNRAHSDPAHVVAIMASLMSRGMPVYKFTEEQEATFKEARREARTLRANATLDRFLEEVSGSPIIFPGAEAMSYLENFIPTGEQVARFKVNFKSPLLVDQYGSEKVTATINCKDTQVKGGYRKDYSITARGNFFGIEADILEMEVVTFTDGVTKEVKSFVQAEFDRFRKIEEEKQAERDHDTDLNVSPERYAYHINSIDRVATPTPKQISPFAAAALLPQLLLALGDKYSEAKGRETEKDAAERLDLIKEYVGMEQERGVCDQEHAQERVSQLFGETLRIYNSQNAIFSGDMKFETGQDINLGVFVTGYKPKTGKLDFVATGHQGKEFALKQPRKFFMEDKLVFAGEGSAIERPLYSSVLMRYVLANGIDLRTLKPFESE